jgi:hypothetical protein
MAAGGLLGVPIANLAEIDVAPATRWNTELSDGPVEATTAVDEVMAVYAPVTELPANEQQSFVDPYATRRIQEPAEPTSDWGWSL